MRSGFVMAMPTDTRRNTAMRRLLGAVCDEMVVRIAGKRIYLWRGVDTKAR
jgi:transposase-like protein